MQRSKIFIILIFACIFLFLSCFLDWSQTPNYSLFKIADYAGTYGKNLGWARIFSVLALLIPILSCLTLISIFSTTASKYLAIITGTYSLLFAFYVLFFIENIRQSLALSNNGTGIYISMCAGTIVLVSGILIRKSDGRERKQ